MIPLSEASNRIKGQEMFQILSKSRKLEEQGRDILHFELGDPDFQTPDNIIEKTYDSLKNGETHYSPSSGIKELKEAAQTVTEKSRGFSPSLEQLVVCPGANIQIYYAIACTVNVGDEVIIPDPGFVSYRSILDFLGIKAVPVRLREEDNFNIRISDIEAAITPSTKMIIVNSPSNPTGGVVSKNVWEKIYNLIKDKDIFVLSDEIYARMTYSDNEEKFFSPSKFDQCKERTILVNGFSKSYAMTGWRLGVLTAPEYVAEKVALLQETQLSCVSPFIQKAGIEALSGRSGEFVENMVKEYQKRRDIMVDGFNSLSGIRCYKPSGAFYTFPNINDTGYDCRELAGRILDKAGIASSPGSIFGKYGDGHLRFCYVNSVENIEKMLEKLRLFLSAGS